MFINLVDKHFPKGHILNKTFNRNTTKLSYSCTDNSCKRSLSRELLSNYEECGFIIIELHLTRDMPIVQHCLYLYGNMKTSNISPIVEQKVMKMVQACETGSKDCPLCLEKKLSIITFPEQNQPLNEF